MDKVTEELLDDYAQYLGAILTLKVGAWEEQEGVVLRPNEPPIAAARRTLSEIHRRFKAYEKEGL
jgi:hypothetical protein